MKKTLTVVLLLCLLFSGTALAGKGYSSGGGRSYSSGSSFSRGGSSFSPSRSSSPGRSYSSPGGKSYSSPSVKPPTTNKATPPTGPPRSYSSKPQGGFQTMPAAEQRKVESRVHYQKATAPKDTYTTPKGNSVSINKDDARVVNIRNMPEEKWVTRESRVKVFYGQYYNVPPTVVHYNDPYSTFFWLWLMDRSVNDRAYWAYHHRNDMDEARYRDMLAKDKALEARVRQLEVEKKQRDPSYVPPGIEEDLQYTDEFVNSSVNPTPKPVSFHGVWVFFKWLLIIVFFACFVSFLIWLIFFKKW